MRTRKKMSKKIISLLLAAMIVFGSVAVGVAERTEGDLLDEGCGLGIVFLFADDLFHFFTPYVFFAFDYSKNEGSCQEENDTLYHKGNITSQRRAMSFSAAASA